MTSVAIIIVHYNSEDETRGCLRSLKKIQHENLKISVVVVDNGSKEILEVPESQRPENTTILRSDSNLGFTSGNNLGIRHANEHANPDYILLLNNDTFVKEDFLEELVKTAEKTENAGIITPLIYFAPGKEYHQSSYTEDQHGNVIWYGGGSIDWKNLDSFHRGVDELDRHHYDTYTESDFATGCCALIPRKVLDQIGAFDPRYFLYLEDVDLSIRISKAGYKVVFCPTAKIWHINAGSSGGSGSPLQQYYQTRNRLFFFMKYANNRLRLSVIKFAFKLLLSGTDIERRATFDWLIGRMGKQSLV